MNFARHLIPSVDARTSERCMVPLSSSKMCWWFMKCVQLDRMCSRVCRAASQMHDLGSMMLK